jgi:DNA ligase-4
MPFLFSYVCDLLQRLEDNRRARSGLRSNATIIQEWFRAHHGLLHRDDHNSAALLSALLPEKRTDRVYFIREKKLQIVVGRALGLGRSRIAELGRWSIPEARADLADCVESILKQTVGHFLGCCRKIIAANPWQPNPVSPTHRPVTVEEIDQLLHHVAAACRFSAPAVRRSVSENRPADQELSLGELYRRLSARDAKWLTRLILKNYEPVVLDPQVICLSYHPLLPGILKVQDDLAVAGHILNTLRRDRTVTGKSELAEYLKPTLGVKVGWQTWLKGRSIKHCLSMVQGRVSCEEKMDGEYCQIHIDLSKGYDCIQIFSKSGKDSTADRMALHKYVPVTSLLGLSVLIEA